MARNGSGVYSLPAGSPVVNGDTSDATDLNTPFNDIATDLNTARPIVAGGTGATSAADARDNLGVAVSFNTRDATNAGALASALSDGEIGIMAGLAYEKDSSATGTASATNDLSVDGLVPADVFHVGHFGITGTGNETTRFQAAIDALPAAGGTIELDAGVNYTVTTTSLVVGVKEIVWRGDATINGVVYRELPGINEGFAPGSNRRRVYFEPDGQADAFVRYDFQRKTDYTGGTDGFVSSVMRVYTEIDAAAGSAGGTRPGEWPFQARVDNYSNSADGVAVTGTGRKYADGAVWSGHFNTQDHSDASGSRNAWGIECNISAFGPDPNNRRVVAGIIAHNRSTYSGTPGTDEIGVGVDVYPDTADFKYGVRIHNIGTPGVTAGKFMLAALRIEADAPDQIYAVAESGGGRFKFGSQRDSGILVQTLGVGKNSDGDQHNYSDLRTEVDSNVAGSEDGRWRLYVSKSGASVEFLRINAGAGNPISMNFGGGIEAVVPGANDSGGTGRRALTIANV